VVVFTRDPPNVQESLISPAVPFFDVEWDIGTPIRMKTAEASTVDGRDDAKDLSSSEAQRRMTIRGTESRGWPEFAPEQSVGRRCWRPR